VATGRILGGTGLSNPMKALARIEPLRLSAVETCDGFVLNGTLPWVSTWDRDTCSGRPFRCGQTAAW